MSAPTIVGASESVAAEPNPSRLDVVMGILSVLLVGGFFIDLWAHAHGRVDESFFTPWHAILYASAGLFGGVLLALTLRDREAGVSLRDAVPAGYEWSLLGAGLFLVAGLGDLVWHSVFGIEESVDALLSPTHLALATSGMMMVFGPVRSAWAKGAPTTFPRWLPWVFSMAMGLGILAAFTEYAHTAIDTWPEAVVSFDAARSDLLVVSVDGAQTRIPIDGSDQVWMPDFAPDGRVVASVVSGETGRLVVMNADGTDPAVLYEGAGIFHHADWSPDGSRIAFTAEGDGNPEIYVIPVEGGEPVRLTHDDAVDWGPTWSPDGSQIVFTSNRDGDPDLYVMQSNGDDPAQLFDAPGNQVGPEYSPDGGWIAFETDEGGNADIALIRPDGTGKVTVTTDEAADAALAWSPDGSRIAFASDRTGEWDLYVMEADGSGVENLTRNPGGQDGWAGTSWSPDGRVIATNESGHTPFWAEPYVREALGVTALLIQGALIAGFVLLILRHGELPIGSMTVLVGASGALMTVISDNYWYIVVAVVAGMAGDLIAALARPSARRPGSIRLVAFLVPAVWYALYLLALGVWGDGIGWSVHMTVGGPLLAGAAGLLLSFLAFPGSTRSFPSGS
jgi:TolB protein